MLFQELSLVLFESFRLISNKINHHYKLVIQRKLEHFISLLNQEAGAKRVLYSKYIKFKLD